MFHRPENEEPGRLKRSLMSTRMRNGGLTFIGKFGAPISQVLSDFFYARLHGCVVAAVPNLGRVAANGGHSSWPTQKTSRTILFTVAHMVHEEDLRLKIISAVKYQHQDAL